VKLLLEGVAVMQGLREGGFVTAAPCFFGQERCRDREGTVNIPTDSGFRIRMTKLKFM
jgi:hypothetical protein